MTIPIQSIRRGRASASIIFWMLLLFHSFPAMAQSGIIRGVVLDGQTSQPLPYASVYFNYTTIGTYTDLDGKFALSGLAAGEYDLIVSFVGHKSYQKKFTIEEGGELRLTISLEVAALKEVQIHSTRDEEWEKQLRKFEKLFLGTGKNSKQCKILNPWVLSFQEEKGGLFIAKATEALAIENLGLGYRISYQLNNFVVNHGHYLATGYVRFQEFETLDTLVSKQWAANRDQAYQGSTRHLFRSMIEHCLEEESYELLEDRSGLKEVVRTSRFSANLDKTIFIYPMDGKIYPSGAENTYAIQLPSRLEVHYKEKNIHSKIYWDIPYPVSWIETKGASLIVTESGIVLNPSMMTVSGYMFDARIADILPNDYQPDIQYRPVRTPAEKKSLSALASLIEKPYLHTDRSYYYANEIIWFKAYMNYFSRTAMDSLSKVLYVDLVDSNQTTLLSRIVPIQQGLGKGELELPSGIPKGDYILRAYTRWMLNFDPEFTFAKSIKVLATGERVREATFTPDDAASNILITMEPGVLRPREKVTVTLDVVNALGKRIPASLSISVTDLALAVPPSDELTILSDFGLPIASLPDTLAEETLYRIQRGFDLQGSFLPSKGKETAGLVTLVQVDANMDLTITTEKDGRFFIPNLLLYDSSRFSIAARTVRGKPGKVILDSAVLVPPFQFRPPLSLDVYKTMVSVTPYRTDFTMPATLLEELSVKATRITQNRTSVLAADYEVDGQWLRDHHMTDVLSGIQRRVPGLRIIIANKDGFLVKYLLLGGPSSFSGLQSQEPLVLIDGVVVNEMPGGPAEQIERLSVSDIESVEVTKFGNSAAYGARGGNGIIAIHTRRGAPDQQYSNIGAYDKRLLTSLPIKGFSTTRKFTAPDYSTSPRSTAGLDNRSTLYWNPDLSVAENSPCTISFFASDTGTQYRIVVEGVTADGSPVHGEKIVFVKENP